MTRKVTRDLANITQGLKKCLYMANIDAMRDWGHAKDYVRMQWFMLQQDKPEHFVIDTGVQCSVREFIIRGAKQLGITLHFKGVAENEKAIIVAIDVDSDAINILICLNANPTIVGDSTDKHGHSVAISKKD